MKTLRYPGPRLLPGGAADGAAGPGPHRLPAEPVPYHIGCLPSLDRCGAGGPPGVGPGCGADRRHAWSGAADGAPVPSHDPDGGGEGYPGPRGPAGGAGYSGGHPAGPGDPAGRWPDGPAGGVLRRSRLLHRHPGRGAGEPQEHHPARGGASPPGADGPGPAGPGRGGRAGGHGGDAALCPPPPGAGGGPGGPACPGPGPAHPVCQGGGPPGLGGPAPVDGRLRRSHRGPGGPGQQSGAATAAWGPEGHGPPGAAGQGSPSWW